jgi:hypothetical protein
MMFPKIGAILKFRMFKINVHNGVVTLWRKKDALEEEWVTFK